MRIVIQMISGGFLQRALRGPPFAGNHALLFGIVAVAAPTLIRVAVNGLVSTAVFLTYTPFVLLSALLLTPRQTAVVALACASIAHLVFTEPYLAFGTSPNDVFSVGVFLVNSVLIIGLVSVVRSFIGDCLAPNVSGEISSSVIFSEKEGEAWVSWPNARPSVKLGPHKEVAKMMEDYIAQVELGERLLGHKS